MYVEDRTFELVASMDGETYGKEVEYTYGPVPLWPSSGVFSKLLAAVIAVTWFGRETWTGVLSPRYLPVY